MRKIETKIACAVRHGAACAKEHKHEDNLLLSESNTVVRVVGATSTCECVLHGNVVFKAFPDGTYKHDFCGCHSKTTASRINACLAGVDASFRVHIDGSKTSLLD